MFSIWFLIAVAIAYLGVMFVVGIMGDKFLEKQQPKPWIYSLALGVHCTTWSFFGTTAQSAQYGWAFTPTYAGAIVLFLFFYPLYQKVARLCQQHQVGSLAELIGLRFNRSTSIAAFITLISLLGVVPYTSLQLEALSNSIQFLAIPEEDSSQRGSLYISILMAIFAILFGVRSSNLVEKRSGLMTVIAFESVVKLLAFCAIGIYICYYLYDGILDVVTQAAQNPKTAPLLRSGDATIAYIGHMLLGFCSMFCLPRQFHINFVEVNGEKEMQKARWIFPSYLFVINLFVLPIALAASLTFQENQISGDLFILAFPASENNEIMAIVGFLGGIAAATSMIIVATLAMGIMVANNIITPYWLQRQLKNNQQQSIRPEIILFIRRSTVVLVIGISYLYYKTFGEAEPLANSGILSIALLAQFVPALILNLYWRRGNKAAFLVSTSAGILAWGLLLLWPSIRGLSHSAAIPTDAELSQAFIISLLMNTLIYVAWSLVSKPLVSGQTNAPKLIQMRTERLMEISEKLLEPKAFKELVLAIENQGNNSYVSPRILGQGEKALSAHLGQGGAKMILSALTDEGNSKLESLLENAEEVSQSFQFNQELLRASVQHIEQGICVIDRELNLVAWNAYYEDMFDYPTGYLQAGMNMQAILQFNADRGILGNGKQSENEITKRIELLKAGSRYKYRRYQRDGKAIEIQGSPMPGGGFVTTYSDITDLITTQNELQNAKLSLEKRVNERTAELKMANSALETANVSKSRFLAAAGHDLMQPFNAASLYASMLLDNTRGSDIEKLSEGLNQSLNNAEELLSALLDFSKLESGVLSTNLVQFEVNEVLGPLVAEASIMALQKGLELRYVPCSKTIKTDKKLFRRIMQNLISNAIRYTTKGKILVGAKKQGQHFSLFVIDTGPGIPKDKQQDIFQEFQQLGTKGSRQGLGLGLTIVERMSTLLSIPIRLDSTMGKGTSFSALLKEEKAILTNAREDDIRRNESRFSLPGKTIWIIDNDNQVLSAMQNLFLSWKADVHVGIDAQPFLTGELTKPDLILIDYYLDHDQTGIEELKRINEHLGSPVPTILNTANHEDNIRQEAIDLGLYFLHKPLKQAALKRLLRKILL